MMQDIDDSLCAAIFIGYHASAGNVDGTAAHTVSGRSLSSTKIDGAEMGGMIAYLPNVERADNHTVRFVGTIIETSMFLEMTVGYPSIMNQ